MRKFVLPKLTNAIEPVLEDCKIVLEIPEVVGPQIHLEVSQRFQLFTERKKWLTWSITASDEAIRERISSLEKTLTPLSIKLKYRCPTGISTSILHPIIFIEDMEIALGIHPGCS